MILKRISILNYKNLEQVEIGFSAKLNCFFGQNGMGKTNLLDAVYFLSFCKSSGNPIDSQNIRHDQDFFVIQGFYEAEDGTPEEIYCGMKRRSKKQFKRNKKEYSRFSDHIGFLPLVMVSPADSELIAGGSDERRRFMDVVISQYDKEYLEALIRYNKALAQRNTLLKSEFPVEEELFLVWEEMMAQAGEIVFRKREAFIEEFIPIFQSFYSFISQDKEQVGLSYDSHARDASLLEVLKQNLKRLMAFSSISQAGYIMLGVIGGTAQGMTALVYYVLVYAAANLGVFAVITIVALRSQKFTLEDYAGLYKTNPKIALLMTLSLFSLAGIPPFAGFFSKFFIFMAAFDAGFHLLVFIALVNTVISLYYYLLIVKAMYITPSDNPIPTFRSDRCTKWGLALCTLGIIGLGIASIVYQSIDKLSFGI